jgi:hypothetical protein
MEGGDLVGLRKKMMAASLTRGPGKAATQGAGPAYRPKREKGEHPQLARPACLSGPRKKEGKGVKLGHGRDKAKRASGGRRRGGAAS